MIVVFVDMLLIELESLSSLMRFLSTRVPARIKLGKSP